MSGDTSVLALCQRVAASVVAQGLHVVSTPERAAASGVVPHDKGSVKSFHSVKCVSGDTQT